MRTMILALACGLAGALALSAWRNPLLRTIRVRTVTRRRSSTLLVVLGSMVGTAMIAGSLAIDDSFERMAYGAAFDHLGEVDQAVSFIGPDGRPAYFSREQALHRADEEALNAVTLDEHGEALVDGVLPAVAELVPVQKLDADANPTHVGAVQATTRRLLPMLRVAVAYPSHCPGAPR